MRALSIARPGEALTVLCLGAHADDIEIGAGGTILAWITEGVRLDVHWCVLSAAGSRAYEAEASATAFLNGASKGKIEIKQFEDGYFPYNGVNIKNWMKCLRDRVYPDVIFTHQRDDAHQDHREVCKLTWNVFRDHLIFEYEIPKWDGDLPQPNIYMPLKSKVIERKVGLLLTHFGTQRSKDWFDAETFRGLARLRGIECRAPDRYAEAFILAKGQLQ